MSADPKHDLPREFPWPQPNGIFQQYGLHCHCGAIRLSMKISPPLYEQHAQGKETYIAAECHCSWCERNGIHAAHPLASNVTWTKGYEDRGEYRFNEGKAPHIFCKRCASVVATDLRGLMETMGQEPRYTVNLRMLKDHDPTLYKLRQFDSMKHMGPEYELKD